MTLTIESTKPMSDSIRDIEVTVSGFSPVVFKHNDSIAYMSYSSVSTCKPSELKIGQLVAVNPDTKCIAQDGNGEQYLFCRVVSLREDRSTK